MQGRRQVGLGLGAVPAAPGSCRWPSKPPFEALFEARRGSPAGSSPPGETLTPSLPRRGVIRDHACQVVPVVSWT